MPRGKAIQRLHVANAVFVREGFRCRCMLRGSRALGDEERLEATMATSRTAGFDMNSQHPRISTSHKTTYAPSNFNTYPPSSYRPQRHAASRPSLACVEDRTVAINAASQGHSTAQSAAPASGSANTNGELSTRTLVYPLSIRACQVIHFANCREMARGLKFRSGEGAVAG